MEVLATSRRSPDTLSEISSNTRQHHIQSLEQSPAGLTSRKSEGVKGSDQTRHDSKGDCVVIWRPLPSQVSAYSARYGHAVVKRSQTVFLFGGNNGGTEQSSQYLNDMFSYNIDNGVWTNIRVLSTAPAPRAGHSMISHGKRVHVYGGTEGRDKLADFWSYDPDANVWGQRVLKGEHKPLPRAHHSAVLWDNQMIVYGGSELEGSGVVWSLNMLDKSWKMLCGREGEANSTTNQTVTPLPRARSCHSAVILLNKLHIFGGRFIDEQRLHEDELTNELWEFDLISHIWSFKGPEVLLSVWPSPRALHAAVVVGSRWIIHGGRSHVAAGESKSESTSIFPATWQIPLNEVWTYQFTTGLWERLSGAGLGNSSDTSGSVGCQSARWGHKLMIVKRSNEKEDKKSMRRKMSQPAGKKRIVLVIGGATLAPVPLC